MRTDSVCSSCGQLVAQEDAVVPFAGFGKDRPWHEECLIAAAEVALEKGEL